MARNKKAQILAAVMCASSILGGYTVVSAQSFTQGNSTVSVNDDSISAKVNGTDSQSTITVGDTSLSVNVGSKLGIFNLYSKNLDVSNSAFSIKSGTFKVGENFNVTNSGKMTANDGMNVTDKYQTKVYFGSGNNYTTSTKVITANTTTSYAGITNKIDTTLDGHKTYTSSTVVGPTSVTTTVQGNGTIDGVSGSKNKITSTVNTTGVTDKVYDVKGKNVASSSVTTSGIANTTNLYTTTSTDETMVTASRQDKNGVSISAKKNNSTVGTSTSSSLVLNGENANLSAGAASVKVNATTGNVAIAANGTEGNVTLSGKNIRLTPTSLSLYDGGQSYASLSNKGLTINGTSQSKISATKDDNSASTNIVYNNIKDTVTDGDYTTTSSTVAKGVTTSVKYKGNDVAFSSVANDGIKDYVYDGNGNRVSSVITNTNGTKFSNSNSGGSTTISGGTITATEDIYINKTSLSKVAEAATKFTNGTDKSVDLTDLTGIDRTGNDTVGYTTTIEGNKLSASGIESAGDVKTSNGYSLNDIGDNTQKIEYSSSQGTLINSSLSAIDIKNANNTFNVDKDGNLEAETITSKGDVKTGNYSLNTIGDNTQKIEYSPSQGTLINSSLSAIDIKNANNTFNVDKDGNLEAKTITSEGDVKAGNYSLNTIGGKIDELYADGGAIDDITALKQKTDGITRNNGTTIIEGNELSSSGIKTDSINGVSIGTVPKTKISTLSNDNDDQPGDIKLDNINVSAIDRNTQAMTYNNGTTSFEGDVTSKDGNTTYSLNNVGEKTSAIDYSQTNGESTTSIRGHLVVTDIKNATKTFNVDNSGNLEAATVASKGDVTSGSGYSLNTIGDNTANITRDGFTTNINGELSVSDGNIITNKDVYTTNVDGTMKYSLNQVGAKTAGIEHDAMTNTTTVEGVSFNNGKVDGVDISELNASVTENGGDITALQEKTKGIIRDENGTTIEGTTTFDSNGVTVGDLAKDGSSTGIGAGQATFNKTDANGNYTYTQIDGGIVTASEDVKLADGTSLSNIGAKTAGIDRDEYGTTTIEGMTSFDAAGMSMGDVNSGVYTAVTPGNATFADGNNGITQINGGTITTNTIKVGDNTIDETFFGNVGKTNANTAGIRRELVNGQWTTYIEGNTLKVTDNGYINLNADKLTYSYDMGNGAIGFGTLGGLVDRVDALEQKTQGIDYDEETGTTTIDGNLSVDGTTGGSTGEGGTTTTTDGNITANTANIGGVEIGDNTVTAQTGKFENIAVGGEGGTTINKDGVTVGNKDNYTSITNNDVVVNNNGTTTSLTDVGNRVTGLESSMNSMNNRLNDVEDRIDKVGAMSAAIANLRTMGFDPEAPTEIAIGIGQYKSETGIALGVFHYPNQDFMLSASISTSGDEVMGGIGATWKLGRKSSAEKAKDEEAKHLEKAEEMKKLAQESKVKAQAERHAKLLAEREAQKTA